MKPWAARIAELHLETLRPPPRTAANRRVAPRSRVAMSQAKTVIFDGFGL